MPTRPTQRSADVSGAMQWRQVQKLARCFWRGVRDWCGDSAYERYLSAEQQRRVSADKLLTQGQFYVEQLDRRYSRPNRCC
jgi:uncharacterized short protein YbdD (DUF466 family)